MEQMRKKICRLRCVLCREGLLQTYNVYDVPVDESRLGSFALEIAGNLLKGGGKTRRLLTFDNPLTCKVGDLVSIGAAFYRMTAIESVYGLYHVIELEVVGNA